MNNRLCSLARHFHPLQGIARAEARIKCCLSADLENLMVILRSFKGDFSSKSLMNPERSGPFQSGKFNTFSINDMFANVIAWLSREQVGKGLVNKA